MKKFLAILLAMMLVMVSVAAMATSGDTGDTGNNDTSTTTEGGSTEGSTNPPIPNGQNASPEQTITISKAYTVNTAGAETPTHVVNFTVTPSISKITTKDVEEDDNPLIGQPSVDETVVKTAPVVTLGENKDNKLNVSKGATEVDLPINLPAYDHVGIYEYEITETADNNKVAGVVYSSYTLRVTIVDINGTLKIGGLALRKNNEGDKTDTIVNGFEAGQLTVTKSVTGNLGDKDKDFNFKVTFTNPTGSKTVNSVIYVAKTEKGSTTPGAKTEAVAEVEGGWTGNKEYTFTLKDTESVTFTNIPNGVTWVVAEDSYTDDGYSTSSTGDSSSGITADGDEKSTTFTNNKEITPDTGITLETLPYVLMMALAMMGLVALKLRKREEY